MFKFNRELLSGSFVLLIAFNIFSLFNFVYQFLMARLLTPIEYGTLAALFSIVYASAVFSESIQTIITKRSSEEKNLGKIKNLFKRTFRKALWASIVLFLLFLAVAKFLADAWSISYLLVVLTGVIIFGAVLSPISRGIMQGKKRFKSLGYSLIIESTLKILVAVALIVMGFRVGGAICGLILATLVACGIAIFQIRDILKSKEKRIMLPAVYRQSLLIFIFTLAVTLFYSLDIVIAKAVFAPETAGYYAIASILGKIVFWGTQPISRAMLPIAAGNKKTKQDKIKSVFYSSISILTIGLIFVLFLFYEFPELIVRLFSGKELIIASGALFKVGLAMALISYSNIFLFYKIATTKESELEGREGIKNLLAKGIFFVILLEIELLILYTSVGSVNSFSTGLLLSAIIFLIGSLIVCKIRK